VNVFSYYDQVLAACGRDTYDAKYLLYRYSTLGCSPFPEYYSITPVLCFTILSYVSRPRTRYTDGLYRSSKFCAELWTSRVSALISAPTVSPRVVSLLVLALVISAPAVSSLWYGLRQSHSVVWLRRPDYLGPGDIAPLLPNTNLT
jgi:hypothetical protein